MPRLARSERQGEFSHITARGSGRRIIFEDDEDKRQFLALLERISDEEGCEVHAWCLMDNHVHLLVRAPAEPTSKMMHRLLSSYARWFNGRHGHVGPVFQGRFASSGISSDDHFLTAVKYIHTNPRDLGEADFRDYPWSSYGQYVGDEGFCRTDTALEMLGGTEAFETFHDLSREEVGCASLARQRITDAEADSIAQKVCGPRYRDELAAMPVAERDRKLVALREAGISIRQIERLTGIGRGTIAKAKRR